MLKQDSYIDSKYVILNGTLLSVKDNAENVVIPSEVNGHRIRRLGAGIHSGNDVKAVIISEGITEIGENAFNNSRSLETVVLPASLKSLGMNSFDSVKRNLKPKKIFLKRAFSRRDFDYILSKCRKWHIRKVCQRYQMPIQLKYSLKEEWGEYEGITADSALMNAIRYLIIRRREIYDYRFYGADRGYQKGIRRELCIGRVL